MDEMPTRARDGRRPRYAEELDGPPVTGDEVSFRARSLNFRRWTELESAWTRP